VRLQVAAHDGARWSEEIDRTLDSDATLVLAFGASRGVDAAAILDDVAEMLPRATLLGCSTAGEIGGAKVSDGTVTVAIVRFERTALRAASAPVTRTADSFAAGAAIGASLAAPDLRAVLVLSDGTLVNGSALVRGLSACLAPDVVVTGGGARVADPVERTRVFAGTSPAPRHVAGVGL
jgi:hypothetical protein